MGDREDFTPLGSVALRIVAGLRRTLDETVRDLNAERAAHDATTTTLARREAEIRERAGERKDAAE
ncbi:hypothetical protein ACTZWW_04400 [Salinarimonas sp. NSM]|uniref:hypothetical protein n=1 Tax=Salinarimonas sp. NSM TaxID=3458003 RepID=UPI0040354CC1